ncbi:MAG: [protein-PII] uridylyltransferase [Desulforhopalus sp.]|nr:[protein-PII] uridylyltransferase [Desulforhopalus sp.]
MLNRFKEQRERLHREWSEGQITSCAGFTHAYSDVVDEFILSLCASGWDGVASEDVAVVALGGYGRREMFPFSDVDLMVLYSPAAKEKITDVADTLFYPLWDSGVELGHGVRTVKESIAHAKKEYFFQVALLDARLLCGSQNLFNTLQETFRSKFTAGNREGFVRQMKAFRDSRLARYGSDGWLLEPHIKDGRGGMRDFQAMLWTGQVVFGLRGLEEFENGGLLLSSEREELADAESFLCRLRCHAHYLSRRKTDLLYFEQQSELAGLSGYTDSEGGRAVELFMADVYGALETIHRAANLFFEHVDDVLGLIDRSGRAADKVLETGIEIKGGRIQLTASSEQVKKKPQLLIRVYLAMARTGLPMHHRTRQLVTRMLPLFGDKERNSPRLAKAFFACMMEAKDVLSVLVTMLETGMLDRIIPEFTRIHRLAQYDLYHIYTVDRHSLQTVSELHAGFTGMQSLNLTEKLADPKVLYLAALLHDIGKGSGRDHSIEGAGIARSIGKRLNFTPEETDDLDFLIRYHLFMPESAMRRDLDDPEFIERCAKLIGTPDRLAMLYCLSIADSRATGPSAWSEWKARLLEEMYLRAGSALSAGAPLGSDRDEEGVEWLRDQLTEALGDESVRMPAGLLSGDYISTFSTGVVISHLRAHRDNYQRIRQRSFISAEPEEKGWKVLIMTADAHGVLAKICGLLTLHGLTVSRARIFTWEDGTVVDVLDVMPPEGVMPEEVEWDAFGEQLDQVFSHRFPLAERLYTMLEDARRKTLSKLVGEVRSRVMIDNDSSDKYSVIEVHAPDLPGQLYRLTQRLADLGLHIHRAYIATEVELLIDVFYVLDAFGGKVTDTALKEKIETMVLEDMGDREE